MADDKKTDEKKPERKTVAAQATNTQKPAKGHSSSTSGSASGPKSGSPSESGEKSLTDSDPYTVLSFVQMTERAVQGIERQNRLVFVVNRKADKAMIKTAAERAFNTKITKVNTLIDQRGRKRAFITFAKPGEAGEIAIRLGII